MTSIKLLRIPDRTPIKITITVLPELHQMLSEYADLYRTTYGANEPIADLVPHMLAAFLASDRAFARRKIAPDNTADASGVDRAAHVHIMVLPRRLSDNFGTFAESDLCSDRGAPMIVAEWADWHD